MRIPRSRRQAGDTIVEVLICIGIISVALTGAFVVASKSSNGVQDSNEHSQAQLQLQSQVELLRQYVSTNTAPTGINCMASDGSRIQVSTTSANGPASGSTDPCFNTIGGANYHFYFTQTANLYTFRISWDSLNGDIGSESYIYRAYPSS